MWLPSTKPPEVDPVVTDRERDLSRQFWDKRYGRRSGSGGGRRRQGLPWWVITIAVVLLLWLLFGR